MAHGVREQAATATTRRGSRRSRRWPLGLGLAVSLALPVTAVLTAGAAAPASAAAGSALGVDPDDTGALSAVTRIAAVQDAWAAGWTGKGVDVAVIDTGVARVPGLDGPGQVLDGPDLSFDGASGAPLGVDAHGHGTFMAGLIAGRDAGVTASAAGCTTCLNSSGFSTTAGYVGVAPESRIINVKVGASDGAADVTQVIAAVDWVVQHAHDPGLNIRVLSLSYGSTSAQPYTEDPLAQAVEQAWKHGIVVVVSAGNDGKTVPELASPAYDPYVVAVGGLDAKRTLDPGNDKVPSFAQRGSVERPVDVIAPAVSVVGLRVPGGHVDTMRANTGREGTRFQRGTGTSQAAALVAGVAALVVHKYPQAGPDQVKALLTGSARALPKGNRDSADPRTLAYSGHGTVQAAAALARPLPAADDARQSFPASTGTGTLDATRNGVHVSDGGSALTGDRDIFGRPYDVRSMAAQHVAATAWTGGIWNGSRWSGDGWTASGWEGSRWSGSRWSGASWDGSRWSGASWQGSRWSAASWDGSRWSAAGWDGSRWSAAGWDGSRWSAASWDGSRWSTSDWS